MIDIVNGLRRIAEEGYRFAGDAADEIERLRASLKAAEKERDALRAEVIHIKEVEFPRKAQAVADGWRGRCERLEAKIAKMEQQVPVAEWIENRFHQYPQLVWNKKYRVNIGDKLYALPGAQAQPASSIPVEAIGKMLADVMAVAVSNGANSVSMPDEYVEVAVWLQGECPTQPAPSVPDGWKEAAIAWEVCASIHREYGKGKDPFFNTRQWDFVKHANDARAMLAAAPEAKS